MPCLSRRSLLTPTERQDLIFLSLQQSSELLKFPLGKVTRLLSSPEVPAIDSRRIISTLTPSDLTEKKTHQSKKMKTHRSTEAINKEILNI